MTTLFEILFKEAIADDIKKKYPQLANFIDTELASVPPKYLLWATKQLAQNPDNFMAKQLESLINGFDQLSKQNKIQNKDINSYKTLEDLGRVVMQASQKISHGDETKAKRKAREEMQNQETKTIRDDSQFLITVPATWEASCSQGVQPKSKEEGEESGEGEYWCVSNPFSRNAWDAYRKKGVKFVFVRSKMRKAEDKYFLIAAAKWPSGAIQYTDSKNSLVDDSNLEQIFGNESENIQSLIQSA